MLRGCIEHVWIVLREQQRRVPLETLGCSLRTGARRILRPGTDVAPLLRAVIVHTQEVVVRAAKDHIGIIGFCRDVAALPTRGFVPVADADALFGGTMTDPHSAG